MEVCDGLDNDCDGQVDELTVLADTHNESLVIINPGSGPITMFAYEASHADAGKDANNKDIIGTDITHRPCSADHKLPWTSVKKEDAEAACEKIGDLKWRLCTAAEWLYACNRGTTNAFPYAATYSKMACNGYDYGAGAPITGGTATGCTSDFGMAVGKVYDLSGNTKEWVATTLSGTTPFHPTAFEMRGGAYNTLSFVDSSSGTATTIAPGLQCDSTTAAPTTDVLLPSVGFRCCHPGALN
jgi:formylglycine-generating enzyme required for sulfatase activity